MVPGEKKNPLLFLTIPSESPVRLCDKAHLHRGAQADNSRSGSPNNTLFMPLPGPSQEPSAHHQSHLRKPRGAQAHEGRHNLN